MQMIQEYINRNLFLKQHRKNNGTNHGKLKIQMEQIMEK